MIERFSEYDFRLICDWCEEPLNKVFKSFKEAVEYKSDWSHKWVSIRDGNGIWHELCPNCNNGEVIMKLKGMKQKECVEDTLTDEEVRKRLADIINNIPEEMKEDAEDV